jgi:hypothetical protein
MEYSARPGEGFRYVPNPISPYIEGIYTPVPAKRCASAAASAYSSDGSAFSLDSPCASPRRGCTDEVEQEHVEQLGPPAEEETFRGYIGHAVGVLYEAVDSNLPAVRRALFHNHVYETKLQLDSVTDFKEIIRDVLYCFGSSTIGSSDITSMLDSLVPVAPEFAFVRSCARKVLRAQQTHGALRAAREEVARLKASFDLHYVSTDCFTLFAQTHFYRAGFATYLCQERDRTKVLDRERVDDAFAFRSDVANVRKVADMFSRMAGVYYRRPDVRLFCTGAGAAFLNYSRVMDSLYDGPVPADEDPVAGSSDPAGKRKRGLRA